jgi:hemoglobin
LFAENTAASTIKIIRGGNLMSEETQASLYERIGGEAAVNAAVDLFYQKIADDYRVNRFFENVDMAKQAAHLKSFMSLAFGGPNEYTGRGLREGHARLVKKGLNDSHFDVVLELLGETLQELNVPADLIAEAAALVESVRDDVLGK